jgi:membrane glycosyltransferase
MAVRRWFITIALLANALISGLVLLLLLNDGGWGSSNLLSATESELLIIVALVAFAFDFCLMPVLGISFWARDRGFRKQAAALADAQDRAGPLPVPQPRDPYA